MSSARRHHRPIADSISKRQNPLPDTEANTSDGTMKAVDRKRAMLVSEIHVLLRIRLNWARCVTSCRRIRCCVVFKKIELQWRTVHDIVGGVSEPRPFFGFVQPILPVFSGNLGTLAAHQFKSFESFSCVHGHSDRSRE